MPTSIELTGKVMFYLQKKGYGFVREYCPQCGSAPNISQRKKRCPKCNNLLHDFFFHAQDVMRPSDLPDRYFEGVDVRFQLSRGEGRPRALYVNLVNAEERL